MIVRDDWKKPRSKNDHLTHAEIARLRVAFNVGRKPRDIARELQCSSRIAAKYYAIFRGGRKKRQTEPVVLQPRAAVIGPRFYKSNFEL